MELVLTHEQFEKAFGYKYSDLKIKLEESKDACTLTKLIIIKNIYDLELISYKTKELAYKEGYEDADYYHVVTLSPSSI